MPIYAVARDPRPVFYQKHVESSEIKTVSYFEWDMCHIFMHSNR